MNAREFLELLLPSTGYIFTATPLGRGWANTVHSSLDSAVAHANVLTFTGRNAYFALATYEKDRVWDATWKNPEGQVVGKWTQRTQTNAQFIKSFFLDLDVDPNDADKFASKADALAALRNFTKRVGLPRPMLVDSGGGIHAYWPLANAVTTIEWRPVADKLKAICLSEKFKADRSLTSDQARVLRVLGGYNYRRGMPVSLISPGTPVTFADMSQRLQAFVDSNVVTVVASKTSTALPPLQGAPADPFAVGNLGATNDPAHFDRIVFACPQLQLQVANRGATTGEQLWRAGLGIAKFCEPCEPAWRALSDGHADFTEAATQTKMDNWHTGPTACNHFHQLNPSVCEACPNFGKITSPVQLGRMVVEAPAPVITVSTDDGAVLTVQLPDPPKGYSRRKSDNAIVQETEDEEGNTEFIVICPYDLYPLALRAQSGIEVNVDERSQWRAHLPITKGQGRESRDFDVPLGMLSDTRSLSKHLFSKGIILNGDQPKSTQHYMSAYLQKLADEAGREKLYERLGWHDDHQTFVLGDRVLRRDGSVALHVASTQIRNTTRNGLRQRGTLAGWQQAMQFYNRPGYEGHRFFLYAALGAPIFHMNDTGNKGVLLTASGKSGRGKTTCLKACGSLWGQPDALILNGNKDGSTVNALYSAIGTMHSLPFMWDDITERDPDELRRFLLNISQGQGKRRMTSESHQSNNTDTWETIVLATANTDDISRILSSGRDVNPHLMRMVGVEFSEIDQGVEAKIKADDFLRAMNENHGFVGPLLMKVMVTHYEAIRKGYIKNVAMVDRMLGSNNASAERYWSATVAAAYTGAQLASKMGLINYPIEADLQWMVSHLGKQRETIKESSSTPMEQLTAFLNGAIRHTLILSAKGSSNLDNVVHKPMDELLVRNEIDGAIIYVARSAIMAYCTENRVAFKAFEQALEADGTIIQRNAQKTLGADTVYASGQSRCWKIDGTKLGNLVLPTMAPTLPVSNVIPFTAGAKK